MSFHLELISTTKDSSSFGDSSSDADNLSPSPYTGSPLAFGSPFGARSQSSQDDDEDIYYDEEKQSGNEDDEETGEEYVGEDDEMFMMDEEVCNGFSGIKAAASNQGRLLFGGGLL